MADTNARMSDTNAPLYAAVGRGNVNLNATLAR